MTIKTRDTDLKDATIYTLKGTSRRREAKDKTQHKTTTRAYQIGPEGVSVGVSEAVGSVIYVPRVVFYGETTGIPRHEMSMFVVKLGHCWCKVANTYKEK